MIVNTFQCNKPARFIELYNTLPAPKRLLEIGVQTGRSLRMWANAYPDAEIVGIDIALPSEAIPEKNVTVLQGNQEDKAFLQTLGDFDLIVDDGSHMMSDQQLTFNTLFNTQLRSGGYYVIEDLETSYRPEYLDAPSTVEFLKGLVDHVEHGNLRSIMFIEHLALIKKL